MRATSPTNFRFLIFGISIVGKSNPKCSSKDPNHVFLSVNPKSAIESLSRTAIRDLKLVLNECEGSYIT